MEYIRWFQELDRTSLALAGGKGANLGDMVRAGLPVPPGFVLLTPAYQTFVTANSLQPEIERLAAAVRPDDPDSMENASVAIRALFDQGALPSEIAAAATQAYAQLGGGRVAVRSSATAEDLPGASFAGQQETYLNIEGEDRLLQAVQRCWSSLWTGRAIAYRLRQQITPGEIALAVVVQRQVEAESAGILFTANPVNGRRDQMVIDGAWGLGEAVVSGQVTPDRWVADARTGAVLEARLARKLLMTARRDGVTATVPVPQALQERAVLTAAQVEELAAMGRQVAAHFGSPQDIEWARAGGRLYLVQSRPVTSLFPLPSPVLGPEFGLRAHISVNILQGLVAPFTPMGISVFKYFSRGPARLTGYRPPAGRIPPAFKVAAGRIFLDVTGALKQPKSREGLLWFTNELDRQTAEALRAVAVREPDLAPDAGLRSPVRPPAAFVLELVSRMLLGIVAPVAVRQRAITCSEELYAALDREARRLKTVEERRQFVMTRPETIFPLLMPKLLPAVAVGQAPRRLTEERLSAWFGDAAMLKPVLRALPHNPTTEMDLALWRVSRRLKAEGVEPTADHPAVQEFLARYGHRAVREIDTGMDRWTDDPTHVLDVLRTFLSHGEEADAEAHFQRGVEEATRAKAEIVKRVRREKGPVRAWLMGKALDRIRAAAGMREYPKFFVVRCLALFRRVLQEAGDQLVAAGRLDRQDDIFFLELDDLTPDGDLRSRAEQNRAEYQRELTRRAAPRVITSTGETVYSVPAAAGSGLSGTAASPGVFEGVVRVIHDPKGARLQPGEVLVAPGTDPAWTPLFLSAGALVMEIGGMMSHGSVVAREYGIPAVVGVDGATQQLRTGQRVRVDGESGIVIPLEP